jgi:hypothetical protein
MVVRLATALHKEIAMWSRLKPRSIYDVMAMIGCVAAIGTGTAYAAATIGSAEVIDESLVSADIKNASLDGGDLKQNTIGSGRIIDNTIQGIDVKNASLTGADVVDNSIGVADIGSQQVASDEVLNDSLLQSDIRAGAVTGDEVLDNSLTGTDINESTLNLPQTPTTTTFASAVGQLDPDNQFGANVGLKFVPAGSYSVVATVHMWVGGPSSGDRVGTAYCELRNGNGFIGGATDRRVVPEDDQIDRSLTVTGGAQVPAGGGDINLHCRSQFGNDEHFETQLMITRLDGFF